MTSRDQRDRDRHNAAIDKAVRQLKALCKRDKVTLYADCTDELNRVIYRIVEVPTFKAAINQPRLL